jgi:multiple antibiotic resistance protein
MHVPPSILSSFVTLLVTIGPVETAAIFASLTAGVHRRERFGLAVRSTAIAGLVLLVFAVGGTFTLDLLRSRYPPFGSLVDFFFLCKPSALHFPALGYRP